MNLCVFLVYLLLTSTSLNIIRADNKTIVVDKKGANEPQPINAKVSCKEETIEITIPRAEVRSSVSNKILSPNKIIFRSDGSRQCQARRLNRDTYRIKANLENKACGTIVKNKKYQTEYTNEVILIDTEAGETRSLFNVTCVYQDKNQLIMLPLSSSETRFSLKDRRVLKVKMSLYRDKSHSYESRIRDVMPEISVGHFVYVSIEFSPTKESLPPNIHIVARSCYASYFSDYRNKQKLYNFISNACADDLTVAIESNGEENAVKWKYQMFKWVKTESQRIYLFCEVELCDSNESENHTSCSTRDSKDKCYGFTYSGRKRREASSDASLITKTKVKNIVAIGPIFPKESTSLLDNSNTDIDESPTNDDAPNKDPNVVPVAIGVVAGVCVIILVIVFYMFWRRRVAKRDAEREKNKKEIEQGFAFVMKSSKDPDMFHESAPQEEVTNSSPPIKFPENDDSHSLSESAYGEEFHQCCSTIDGIQNQKRI